MSEPKKKYNRSDCDASKEQIFYADILFYGAWLAILILVITFGLYVGKILPRHIPLEDVPHYWHERADSWLNPWYVMKEPVKTAKGEQGDKAEAAPPGEVALEDLSEEKLVATMKQEISAKGETGIDKNVAVMETAKALGLDGHEDEVQQKLEKTFAGLKEQGLLNKIKPGCPSGWEWTSMLGKGDYLNFVGVAILAGMTILCFLVALAPAYLKQKDWPYFAVVIFECAVLLLAASGILKVGH